MVGVQARAERRPRLASSLASTRLELASRRPSPAGAGSLARLESWRSARPGTAAARRRRRRRPSSTPSSVDHRAGSACVRPGARSISARHERGRGRRFAELCDLPAIARTTSACVLQQRMQVLPDDVRDQRSSPLVAQHVEQRRRSASMPSSLRAAMATWSRTSGDGSLRQRDDLRRGSIVRPCRRCPPRGRPRRGSRGPCGRAAC